MSASAMSASPVKPPVLPPSGVNVPPPVATTPPKVGIVGIPPSLTIAPTKPANMNHTAMPLSLIADHKMASQFPQPQAGPPPPALQPISQPLPRTPEKPKELSAPLLTIPTKPTSNGMEASIITLQAPVPVAPEAPALASSIPPVAPILKPEPPAAVEVPDGKQILPEKTTEPSVAATAPPTVEREMEKKDVTKPEEYVSETPKPVSSPPAAAPVAQEVSNTSTTPTTTVPPSTPAPLPSLVVATPPPAEQPVPPTVTPSVSRTESTIAHAKPELKVATIPRQAAKRKREPKVEPVTPDIKKEGKEDDRKSKRVRLPTQPYQSPLPELNIIAKISKSSKSTPSKAADDKLIVFYKNEFLAVRNAEGGFYVCQAMQNIYKSSPRIRIRWLSQEDGKDTYSPDFYDHTDFDCILTNLNLDKVDKERFRLPQVEQQRTESILKRALDVEKGVSEKPPVTEEHPDGLDLSLFRDESQLKKTSKSGKKSEDEETDSENDEENVNDDEEDKISKTESEPKTSKKKKKSAKKKPPPEKKSIVKSASVSNKSTVQPSTKKTETRVGSKRKSSVGSNSQPPEKKVKKSDSSSQPSDRTNKTRSVGAVATVREKSRRDRRAKSRK